MGRFGRNRVLDLFLENLRCTNKQNIQTASIAEPFPKQALVFTCLKSKSPENTEGKGEIARNEQFLLFPQCFLPIWRTFCHFHEIWNCRLQTLSVWKNLKFVVWERVKWRWIGCCWQKLMTELRRVLSKIRLQAPAGWSCSTLSAKKKEIIIILVNPWSQITG